jgi:hypothetical protein
MAGKAVDWREGAVTLSFIKKNAGLRRVFRPLADKHKKKAGEER